MRVLLAFVAGCAARALPLPDSLMATPGDADTPGDAALVTDGGSSPGGDLAQRLDGPPADLTSPVVSPLRATVGVGRSLPITALAGGTTCEIEEGDAGGSIGDGDAGPFVYVAPFEAGVYHVRATAPDGSISRVEITVRPLTVDRYAGVPHGAGTLDGVGAEARLTRMMHPVSDGGGTIYFVDGLRLRALDLGAGAVRTLAGDGQQGHVDGVGGAARFFDLRGLERWDARRLLATDGDGTLRVFEVDTGRITTLAGGSPMGTIDGTGAAARFDIPTGLVVVDTHTALVLTQAAASFERALRQVNLDTGEVVTLHDKYRGVWLPGLDNPHDLRKEGDLVELRDGSQVLRYDPATHSVTALPDAYRSTPGVFDGAGGRVWCDFNGSGELARIDLSSGQRTVIAPNACDGWNGFAPALVDGTALFGAVSQTLYGEYPSGPQLARIDLATGATTVLAGPPLLAATRDGQADAAIFGTPDGIAVDQDDVYVADRFSIRRIARASAEVSTWAGSGISGAAAISGNFGSLRWGMALADGVLYAADDFPQVTSLWKIATATAQMTPAVVGSCVKGLAVDAGWIYTTNTSDGTLYRGDLAAGGSSLFLGRLGEHSTTDGDAATARFTYPGPLAFGPGGRLYVGDGPMVRTVDTRSLSVTTLAGAPYGSERPLVDGMGAAARFGQITGLAHDGLGVVYVSDPDHNAIRHIDLNTHRVTTLLGAPMQGGFRPGALATARINQPMQLAVTAEGDLLVTDAMEGLVVLIH